MCHPLSAVQVLCVKSTGLPPPFFFSPDRAALSALLEIAYLSGYALFMSLEKGGGEGGIERVQKHMLRKRSIFDTKVFFFLFSPGLRYAMALVPSLVLSPLS